MPVKTALIIVDVQYDFLPPAGSMAVKGGDLILPGIYQLLDRSKWDQVWDVVVATQDWHPNGHVSFASRHADAAPYTSVKWNDTQTGEETDMSVWPDHCIQGSRGAELEDGLAKRLEAWQGIGRYACFRKAYELDIEAFSAFEGAIVSPDGEASQLGSTAPKAENTRSTSELGIFLADRGVERVVVVGLATDYTCLSALSLPSATSSAFQVILPLSMIEGVAEDTSKIAIEKMKREGAITVEGVEELRRLLDE